MKQGTARGLTHTASFAAFTGRALTIFRAGLLTIEEACQRYTLTVDEFLSWQSSIDRHGLAGLKPAKLQKYRATP